MRVHIGMWSRIVAGVACLTVLAVGVYLVYFRHPPAADILAANKSKRGLTALGGGGGSGGLLDRLAPGAEVDYDKASPAQRSALEWAWFVEDMNLVSIGDVYDKCEPGDDQVMLGQIAVLPDPDTGGIKTRTYLNFTLDHDIQAGDMWIEIKYNGKDLYHNHWDMCKVEEDMDTEEDKLITCPMLKGRKRFVKDMPVPAYLPKGTYYSKTWLVDAATEKTIVCSYNELTI